MSDNEPKRKLVGPWRTLHGVIWILGLYILFTRGNFFPGIFVLIGVSAIYEALLSRFAPHAFEEEPSPAVAAPLPVAPMEAPVPAPFPTPEHRVELLPNTCPNCGGPIRGHEVRWTGPQSADCPYCGTNLPMNKNI
jgi:hypothetical protein